MKPLLTLCASASMLFAASAYGDANTSSADLRSFFLSASTISASASSTLNAQWDASASNSPTGYFVSAHAIPASSADRTPTDGNRFLQHTCMPAGSICGHPHIQPCTFNKKQLSCSFHTATTLAPGKYVIVARACVVDAGMNYVCSSKESALAVLP